MNPTVVVHINEDEWDVKIDRTTKFGNPYSHKDGTLAKYKTKSRKESLEKFRDYAIENLLEDIEELRGKRIACWCRSKKNPKSCHGDIIVELLNQKFIV